MRITNEVRNYVNKKINNKALDRLDTLKSAKDLSEASEECDKLRKKAEEIAKKAIEEVRKLVSKSSVCELKKSCYHEFIELHPMDIDVVDEIADAFNKDRAKIMVEAKNISEEILAELSLGGNKATLDKLLSEASV